MILYLFSAPSRMHAPLTTPVLLMTSDRIVMLANGPAATMGEILEVDLDNPRNRLALANDARYHTLRGEVLEFLYQKQAKAAA